MSTRRLLVLGSQSLSTPGFARLDVLIAVIFLMLYVSLIVLFLSLLFD